MWLRNVHIKYNAYEVCELLLFVFDMGYDKKKYSFFSSNYEQGGNKYVPKCNHTFYWHPPSTMQLRVSHYYSDVILHFTKSGGMNKPDRYLPMREAEFVVLLSMVDEINKQIKKTKKIAKKRNGIWMMKQHQFHTSSLATHAEKKAKQMSCTQQ